MTDPVVDHEGNSYDRAFILEWLTRNETSPITRNPLRLDQLSPNRVLRDLLRSKGIAEVGATATATATDDTNTDGTNNNNNDSEDGIHLPGATEAVVAPLFPPRVSLRALHSQRHDENHALIRVSVRDEDEPTHAHHAPALVICVLDVSASMFGAATMHDDTEGNTGLSLLDIVKHATHTVIETLSSRDRLAIVAYGSSARIVLPPTFMTPDNRADAVKRVKELPTSGQTNLWDGLRHALDLVRLEGGGGGGVGGRSPPHASIILLTDGLPNIHPPRGEVPTFRRYQEMNPEIECSYTLSTFGFGYNLDSTLLRDLSVMGNGHFCFIPDSSFVGTVFVNAISNILATALFASTLTLDLPRGVSMIRNDAGFKATQKKQGSSSDGKRVVLRLPPLLYGQTLDVLLQLSTAKGGGSGSGNNGANTPAAVAFRASLSCPSDKDEEDDEEGMTTTTALCRTDAISVDSSSCFGGEDGDANTSPDATAATAADDDAMRVAIARQAIIRLLKDGEARCHQSRPTTESLEYMTGAIQRIRPMFRCLETGSCSTTSTMAAGGDDDVESECDDRKEGKRTKEALLDAMGQDLDGQITEAYSCAEWYRKWGRHYLPSLARAHALQQATNFKDPGLQMYASASRQFTRIRDESEALFCRLPPPEPSRPCLSAASHQPVHSMAQYYNSGDPCFAKGPVQMADGRIVDVSQIKAGDAVVAATASGIATTKTAVVRCVVKTTVGDFRDLVALDGGDVLVTPWHPVRCRRGGEAVSKHERRPSWIFPCDLVPHDGHCQWMFCDALYSFVLGNGEDDRADHVDHADPAVGLQIGSYDAVSLGHAIQNDPVATHEFLGNKTKVLACLSSLLLQNERNERNEPRNNEKDKDKTRRFWKGCGGGGGGDGDGDDDDDDNFGVGDGNDKDEEHEKHDDIIDRVGIVVLPRNPAIRDPVTGLIVGFRGSFDDEEKTHLESLSKESSSSSSSVSSSSSRHHDINVAIPFVH